MTPATRKISPPVTLSSGTRKVESIRRSMIGNCLPSRVSGAYRSRVGGRKISCSECASFRLL